MSIDNENRFILVYRKTRLQELIERFNTWLQAKFYLEHNGVDAHDYLTEHDNYKVCLAKAEGNLRALGRFQLLERSLLPSYSFNNNDVVVVVGQDGLVANTLKYLDGQPVIAINPEPKRWDGKLLPFEIEQLHDVVVESMSSKREQKSITFAEAATNDGQVLLAVNDIFIGPKSHTSARYKLDWHGSTEVQSSSGIIVSTGFGSTGWFQSVLAGAMGVMGLTQHPDGNGFGWSEKRLQFAVREPFPSNVTGTDIVYGEVTNGSQLILESYMPEHGVIFSDGIEDDFIHFNSGVKVTISVSEKSGSLVV